VVKRSSLVTTGATWLPKDAFVHYLFGVRRSLDGIIRVSVMATGVDINATNNVRPASSSQPSAPPQARVAAPTPSTTMQGPGANLALEAKSADIHEALIAELAQQLKAENARNTERAA
jgi:hypothetical protein